MFVLNKISFSIYLIIIFMGSIRAQKHPYFYKDRSIVIKLQEWKYTDIATECETFLGPKGFGAVLVSPVTENAILKGRPWHERYQPVSYDLNTRSGNEVQLKDMIKRCNTAKIRVYVELVLNHMAAGKDIVGTGGSLANGQLFMYPTVKYNSSDFHKLCVMENFTDIRQIRECQVLGMPDLDQGREFVQKAQVALMNRLIEFGVTGFYITSANNMNPTNLQKMFSQLTYLSTKFDFSSENKPFIMLEVIDYEKSVINRNEYANLGVITEYRFARDVGNAFKGDKTLHSLLGLGPKHDYIPSQEAVVFIHILSLFDGNQNNKAQLPNIQKEHKKYQMAISFMLAHPYGIPIVLSSYKSEGPPSNEEEHILSPKIDSNGQCTNGWLCEHRWPVVQHMIKFRKIVGASKVNNWADNGQNQVGFCRGKNGFIAFHNEQNGNFKTTIPVCVPEGDYFDIFTANIQETKGEKVIKVNDKRKARIEIKSDDDHRMVAFHVNTVAVRELKTQETEENFETEENTTEDDV